MINSLHLIKKSFLNSTNINTTTTTCTKLFNIQQQYSSYFYNNFFTKKEPRKNLNKTKKSNPNDRNKGEKKKNSTFHLKEHTFKKHRKIEQEEENRRIEQEEKKKKISFKNRSNSNNKSIKLKLDKPKDLKKFKTLEFQSNNYEEKDEQQQIEQLIKINNNSKDQPIYTEHNRIKFRVSKDMEGMRVDRWINTKLPVLPHSLVCRWLRNKAIFMENGEKKEKEKKDDEEKVLVEKRHKLKFNDKVTVGSWIYFPSQAILDQQIADVKDPQKFARLSDQEIKEIKESVLYKDDHILVLNKPQGLSVQGGSGLNKHLDMMLSHLCFEKDENPKLVHRLDKATSGILILGRSRLAATAMAEKFELKLVKEKDNNNNNNNNKRDSSTSSSKGQNKNRDDNNNNNNNEELFNKGIKKTYWALLNSTPTPKEGRIRAPLKKVMVGGEEKVVPTLTTGDGAKIAITEYKVLESSLTKQCFVALWPETGRTHQLRVHCASVLNAPIIGDTKYGDKESDDHLSSLIGNGNGNGGNSNNNNNTPRAINRLHLHARRIEFLHPFTNKKIDIVAPLPKELQNSWNAFGFSSYKKIDDQSITN